MEDAALWVKLRGGIDNFGDDLAGTAANVTDLNAFWGIGRVDELGKVVERAGRRHFRIKSRHASLEGSHDVGFGGDGHKPGLALGAKMPVDTVVENIVGFRIGFLELGGDVLVEAEVVAQENIVATRKDMSSIDWRRCGCMTEETGTTYQALKSAPELGVVGSLYANENLVCL